MGQRAYKTLYNEINEVRLYNLIYLFKKFL
jgi:hypothetical protein